MDRLQSRIFIISFIAISVVFLILKYQENAMYEKELIANYCTTEIINLPDSDDKNSALSNFIKPSQRAYRSFSDFNKDCQNYFR